MEAMSCGIPCILSRRIFQDDFEHEENCLLVEPESEALADAIVRLRTDELLYQALCRASVETAAMYFSEEPNRKMYHDLLLGAVN
jgi:glycosyltransferase involved in cell wall biosynthesis